MNLEDVLGLYLPALALIVVLTISWNWFARRKTVALFFFSLLVTGICTAAAYHLYKLNNGSSPTLLPHYLTIAAALVLWLQSWQYRADGRREYD